MAFGGYQYGGYPAPGGYYAPPPPIPDQLAQLRQNQFQQPMIGQNAMQGPMQPQQTVQSQVQQPVAQPQASNGILWVQGEEGAKAWLVAPGTTVMLMDSDGSSFYLKSADASGMPQPLRIFDYVERATTPKTPDMPAHASNACADYVTRDEWNTLAARADALAAELETLKAKKVQTAKKPMKEDDVDG